MRQKLKITLKMCINEVPEFSLQYADDTQILQYK